MTHEVAYAYLNPSTGKWQYIVEKEKYEALENDYNHLKDTYLRYKDAHQVATDCILSMEEAIRTVLRSELDEWQRQVLEASLWENK